MDNSSPLFLAHQCGRKAESCLNSRRFDDAIQCHLQAAEHLKDAMTLTRFDRALDSLRLQHDYHVKQTDIVKVRKLQFEIKKKIIQYRKQRVAMDLQKACRSGRDDKDLQGAILRTMEEADSLIGMLERTTIAEKVEAELQPKPSPSTTPTSTSNFVKRPKDDRTVIEELRTVNTQLRSQITELLSQLDASKREIEMLKARLKMYETENLPELPPLEMPNFNFETSLK